MALTFDQDTFNHPKKHKNHSGSCGRPNPPIPIFQNPAQLPWSQEIAPPRVVGKEQTEKVLSKRWDGVYLYSTPTLEGVLLL